MPDHVGRKLDSQGLLGLHEPRAYARTQKCDGFEYTRAAAVTERRDNDRVGRRSKCQRLKCPPFGRKAIILGYVRLNVVL